MAKIQNTDNAKCWEGCGATETHSFLVGMQNGTATLENSLAVSQTVKYKTTKQPSNSTSSYLPESYENICPHKCS